MFNIGNHDKIINICICICVFVICICIYWTKQITTYSWIPPGFCCILLIAVDCRWATNNLKGICISICLWKLIAKYRIFFNTVRDCLFLAFLLQKFFSWFPELCSNWHSILQLLHYKQKESVLAQKAAHCWCCSSRTKKIVFKGGFFSLLIWENTLSQWLQF